jgi:hypothetical protein
MQNVMSPLVTMYQTQLEASRRFADAFFSGTEKIDRVMIDATHRVVNEQIDLAEAMTTARDPQTAGSTLQSSLFSGNRNNAVVYQKEIMRILAEMQNEIGRSWQDYIQQLRTQATSNAAKPLEAVQTRTNDTVFNPMTSMFSVWESAFKEVADLARKNMVTARTAAEGVSGRAAQQAASYVDATGAAVQEAAKNAVDTASTAAAQAVRTADAEGSEEKRGSSGGGKKK